MTPCILCEIDDVGDWDLHACTVGHRTQLLDQIAAAEAAAVEYDDLAKLNDEIALGYEQSRRLAAQIAATKRECAENQRCLAEALRKILRLTPGGPAT